MNTNGLTIRLEKAEERREVETLVRESFWNVYRPGCLEHFVLHELRKDGSFVPELNFVMEKEGKRIGQAVFVRSKISLDNGKSLPTLTLGPICILPEYQGQGYGKILLDYAFERAKNYGAALFEGNIEFYGKCGCVPASKFGIRYQGLPEGEDASFFLCRELTAGYLDGVQGEYAPPSGYFVDEQAAEEFDKLFPYKEKLKLPGQLFG